MSANERNIEEDPSGEVASLPGSVALILAAGGGSRMGLLKQLIPYRRGTLLSNAIEQARLAAFERIVVVVGAEGNRIAEAIAGEYVEVAENPEWSSGMGSSIRAGMKHLQRNGPLPEVLAILLADQPLVRSSHLIAMRRLQAETSAEIIAAEYQGKRGVPALFTKELFSLLASLDEDHGARHLLRDGQFAVREFALPEAALDLDTPFDLASFEAVRA